MLLFAAAWVFGGSEACAHALLVRATPAVGSIVTAPPSELAITFSEAVEPRFSTISVEDAGGGRLDVGEPHVAEGNSRRLAIALKPLSPGTYSVSWKATSTDTHRTQGHFSFTVKP